MKIHITRNFISHKYIYRIIFRICLDMAYIVCIVPYWGYTGLFRFDWNIKKMVISYIMSFLFCAVTPVIDNSIASVFFNTQLYISIIPMLTLYAYSGSSFRTIFVIFLVISEEWLIYLLLSKIAKKKLKMANKRKIQIARSFLISLVLIILFITIKKVGFSNGFSAMNFYNVYDIREVTKADMGIIESYLLPWATKVIIPFYMVYCLNLKKWKTLFFLVLTQFYFYLAYANKVVLFTVIMLFIVYIFLEKNCLKWLYEKGSILAILLIVIYDGILGKWSILSSLLIRRVFFIPAMLKFSYHEFFLHREKVFYANGLIGKIFHINSPYSKSIPNLIGQYLGMNGYMNTGYLGETYANIDLWGMFLVGFLLIIYIFSLEKFSDEINPKVSLTSSIYLLFSFNEGAFLTILLTYGGIVLLLIFVTENSDKLCMKKGYG